MHSILIHLLCTELHLQLELFFNSAVHFSYIYKENYSLLLRLLRRALLYHLLPRTTFVREEASRDEALRTTERRAWNIYYHLILLPFFIECFRPFAREASAKILENKKSISLKNWCPDERLFLFKPHKTIRCQFQKRVTI